MIKQLAEHVLPNVSKVTLIVSGDSEKVTVLLLSEPKGNGLKPQPITISGTADEVQEAISSAIKTIFADNKELFTNVEEVVADLKKQAGKATKKSAPAKKEDKEEKEEEAVEEVKEEKPPKLDAAQKKAEKEAAETLKKAAAATDPDMVEFLKKQIMKKYEEAKMPDYYKGRLETAFANLKPAAIAETKADDGLFGQKEEVPEAKPVEKQAVPELVKEEPKAAPVQESKPDSTPATQEADGEMIF